MLELGEDISFPEPHSSMFIEFNDKFPKNVVSDFEKVMRNTYPIGIELVSV